MRIGNKFRKTSTKQVYISKKVCISVYEHIRKKKHQHLKFTSTSKIHNNNNNNNNNSSNNNNKMETCSNHPPIHCFFLPPRGVRNPCYLVPDLSRWIKLLRCSPEKSFRSNGGFFGYRVQSKKLKMVASKIIEICLHTSRKWRDNLVLNKSWNCEFQLLDQFILLWNKALCRIQMKFQGGYPRAQFCLSTKKNHRKPTRMSQLTRIFYPLSK